MYCIGTCNRLLNWNLKVQELQRCKVFNISKMKKTHGISVLGSCLSPVSVKRSVHFASLYILYILAFIFLLVDSSSNLGFKLLLKEIIQRFILVMFLKSIGPGKLYFKSYSLVSCKEITQQ